MPDEVLEVRNEFAAVELRVTPYGRGSRLEVRSMRLGTIGVLDATVLEALTRLPHADLVGIVAMAMARDDEVPPNRDD